MSKRLTSICLVLFASFAACKGDPPPPAKPSASAASSIKYRGVEFNKDGVKVDNTEVSNDSVKVNGKEMLKDGANKAADEAMHSE